MVFKESAGEGERGGGGGRPPGKFCSPREKNSEDPMHVLKNISNFGVAQNFFNLFLLINIKFSCWLGQNFSKNVNTSGNSKNFPLHFSEISQDLKIILEDLLFLKFWD